MDWSEKGKHKQAGHLRPVRHLPRQPRSRQRRLEDVPAPIHSSITLRTLAPEKNLSQKNMQSATASAARMQNNKQDTFMTDTCSEKSQACKPPAWARCSPYLLHMT